MDEGEIDRVLEKESDPERAKLRLEALLQLERLKLEREKSQREEERHKREQRRWYANPFFVALVAGAATIAGNVYVSWQQGRSDLIISALAEDAEQSLQNLEFLISAGLLTDWNGNILSAARVTEPRAAVPPPPTPPVRPGRFERPLFTLGQVVRVTDGDSLTLEVAGLDRPGTGPRPRHRADGTITVALVGIDAPETRFFPSNCLPDEAIQRHQQWGEQAQERLEALVGGVGATVRIAALEVDTPGRLHALVAPASRAPDDLLAIYGTSVNRQMILGGWATPLLYDLVPPELAGRLASDAQAAETSDAGIWAEMGRTVDLSSADFGMAPPWLMRRLCFAGPEDRADLDGYFGAYVERVPFADLATGDRLAFEDVFEVEGQAVTLKRPLHSLLFLSD